MQWLSFFKKWLGGGLLFPSSDMLWLGLRNDGDAQHTDYEDQDQEAEQEEHRGREV